MGTSTFNISPQANAATGTSMRAAVVAIDAGILESGLVALRVTGDLDFASIPATLPTGTDLNFGFRLYELVDSLTPARRFIIRVAFNSRRFGSTNVSFSEVQLGIEAGTEVGADGAWSGQFISLYAPTPFNNSITYKESAPLASFVSAVRGRVSLAIGLNFAWTDGAVSASTQKACMGFASISRTRDQEGNYDARGLVGYGPSVAAGLAQVPAMKFSAVLPDELYIQGREELVMFLGAEPALASFQGNPILQSPLAAVPWLYPYQDMVFYQSYAQYAVGDILLATVGGEEVQMLALGSVRAMPGRVGVPPPGLSANVNYHPLVGVAVRWG